MESAEIKATRSPVEKAGTLCPDSTRCTSQYLHCTEETAQVSHQWSLVDNVCNTNSFMEYQNMVKTARPEPLTKVELRYTCSTKWLDTFLAFHGMAVKKLAVIIAFNIYVYKKVATIPLIFFKGLSQIQFLQKSMIYLSAHAFTLKLTLHSFSGSRTRSTFWKKNILLIAPTLLHSVVKAFQVVRLEC